MKIHFLRLSIVVCLAGGIVSCDRGATSVHPQKPAHADDAILSSAKKEEVASPATKNLAPEDARIQFLKTDNTEEMWKCAAQIKAEGTKGIPTFLNALTNSLSPENRWSVTEYGRVAICVSVLHDLVKEGISTEAEVPVLIFTIRNQTDMMQTFMTAETLRLITGVDTGYSQDFVKGYQEKDEPLRQAKIKQWEEWLHSKKASVTVPSASDPEKPNK